MAVPQARSEQVIGPNSSGDFIQFKNGQGTILSWIDGAGVAQGALAPSIPGLSPSSAYTFTSTPITAAPFLNNLLIGASSNVNGGGLYTAGPGYTLIGTTIIFGFEYSVAGSASSYSAPFGYASGSGSWGGGIAAFSAANPSVSPAFVQGNLVANGVPLAYNSNNTLGNLLVAAIRYNSGAGGPVTSITDTRGNTWVNTGLRIREGYNKGVGNTNSLEIWYAANCAAGANTVTLNGVSGATVHWSIAEFSGISTSNPLVDYAFAGSTASVTSIPGATTNPQYLIQAINNVTGNVDFSGRDAALVVNNATATLSTVGGRLFFKNGIYPGQSALQENVGGNVNFYVFNTPATGTQTFVSWHIEGESFPQIAYTNLQTNGVIFNILPSAWSKSQPAGQSLSCWWQRSSAIFGPTNNNNLFFENVGIRIPDNQRPNGVVLFDMDGTLYCSFINTNADTVIIAIDQPGSGLTPAVSGIVGYRTNRNASDETYLHNTWAVGMYDSYQFNTDHLTSINSHASFGVRAFVDNAQTPDGHFFIHFQDIHCLAGPILNTVYGTRIDMLNHVVEYGTGNFTRAINAQETTPGNAMGRVEVESFSGAVTPFFATSPNNFRVSESTKIYMPGLISSSTTSSATTGTVKQTLATFTFTNPIALAGIFQNNAGGVIRVTAWGITAANGNSKTVEIDFGGTAIATITSTANNGVIRLTADIIAGATSVQECLGSADDATTRTLTRTSPGITGTANIVLNLAATTPTTSGDFTFKGWEIEYLGGS